MKTSMTIRIFLLSLMMLLSSFASAANEDDLLLPEQAFSLKASVIDANTVRAEWTIAKGYYQYRDKFRFQSDTQGVQLGTAIIPKGKIKKDAYFGEVEIFRDKVAVDIPVVRDAGAPVTIALTTVSQGCADIGVCYPPLTQKIALTLPAAAGKPAKALSALTTLGDNLGLGNAGEDFLEPDKAFEFVADATDANTVTGRWTIADGYYMYRDKLKITLKEGPGIKLGNVVLPKGEIKQDEFFGKQEIYHKQLTVRIPLVRSVNSAQDIKLHFSYQGCAESGICYPPINKTVGFNLVAGGAASSAAAATPSEPTVISEQDSIAQALAGDSTLLIILSFFGFGLLLSFTPCVFPMIPILSSIIVGQGEDLTTRRAFIMSLTYVLAMALTYTVAGVIAGYFGKNLQATFQNPWILGGFSGVFVLLALSMFGFYDIQLPASLQSKLSDLSNRQQGGSLIGVGIMGLLSALIVGPCVAPPLAGALIYIGQTGNAALGGLALFALSLGMGMPLIAIGTSAGKILPRAGDWMNAIKAVFGVMLLAIAIWMLQRILPGETTMFLWAVLIIVSAIYMGALQNLPSEAIGWSKLWKGVGVIMLTYGVLLLIGVASGTTNMLRPLENLAATNGRSGGVAMAPSHTNFKQVSGIEGLQLALAEASAQGKPVMLDFYADWCIECKRMEANTFSDPGVQQALANAVLLQADVTANSNTDQALLKQLGLIGPPAILFFGPDGKERRRHRLVGYFPPDEFAPLVRAALK